MCLAGSGRDSWLAFCLVSKVSVAAGLPSVFAGVAISPCCSPSQLLPCDVVDGDLKSTSEESSGMDFSRYSTMAETAPLSRGRGGLPPFLLEPIDFAAVYATRKGQAQQVGHA